MQGYSDRHTVTIKRFSYTAKLFGQLGRSVGQLHQRLNRGYTFVTEFCRKRGRGYEANDGTATGATQETSGEGAGRPLKRQRLVTDVHAWPAGSAMSAGPASATQPASDLSSLATASAAAPEAAPVAATVAVPAAAPSAGSAADSGATLRIFNNPFTFDRSSRATKTVFGPYSTIASNSSKHHDGHYGLREGTASKTPGVESNVHKLRASVAGDWRPAVASSKHPVLVSQPPPPDTAAVSEDEVPVSSTQLHQISTTVGPAEGSVGGPVGLSIFQKETAGSADVSLASDEDEAQQDISNPEYAGGASSWQEAKLGAQRPADMLVHAPTKDVSVVNFVPSNPLHSGGEVPKGDSLHEPLQMGKGTGSLAGSLREHVGLPLPPEGTNVVSAAVFPASGETEPQGTIPGVQHVYGILSEQQARPGVIRPAEYAPSKDVLVMDQLSDPINADKGDEALHKQALYSPQHLDNRIGALLALHPSSKLTSHSTPQLSPQPSPTPDLAAVLEQEPSLDSLQPVNKPAEPEAADAVALPIPAPQASGSFGDGGYSSGYGSDDCSASDGDGSCSSFGVSDSATGESGVDSSDGASSGSASSGSASSGSASSGSASSGSASSGGVSSGASSGSASSGGASSGGASSGGASSGGASSGGAAVEGALPPVPLAVGGSENGSAEKHVGSPRDGTAGGPVHVGVGNIANPAHPTAQQLLSGQVSFSEFYLRLQKSQARQAQSRVLVEDTGRGASSVMEAGGKDMSRMSNPSAKEEASRFLANLGSELQQKEAATEQGKRSQGVGGILMESLAEAPNGVRVGRRHVDMDCDDPSPDADMEEDEYSDYELEDGSGCSNDQSPQPFALRPSVLAGITFLQAFQPSQHAALGMSSIPVAPTINQGQPQLAAEGAPGHGVLSWPQPADHPGAESGSAHQSWEQGNHQSRGSQKRKNDEDFKGQDAVKRCRLSGGTASNSQEGSAQQGAMSRCCHGELDAVRCLEKGSTAVATGAATETAGGQAKQAGPAVAQSEPSANAGMTAHSSYGSPDAQAGVRDSLGVPSCYQFSF